MIISIDVGTPSTIFLDIASQNVCGNYIRLQESFRTQGSSNPEPCKEEVPTNRRRYTGIFYGTYGYNAGTVFFLLFVFLLLSPLKPSQASR